MNWTNVQSPLGELLVVTEKGALVEIGFPSAARRFVPPAGRSAGGRLANRARRQLEEYFAGDRTEFDLPLAPRGTSFQHRVWRAVRDIPFGETISYGELADIVGNPRAARAVGAANKRNPLPIVIPCHRVIGSSGLLTGFAGGLPTKQALLDHESRDPVLFPL